MIARCVVLLMAAAAVAPPAAAQSLTTGSVYGTVTDADGAVLQGARVVLTQAGTGFERVMETAGNGRFEFGFLPPGDYELFVERLWSQPLRWVGIPVRPGRRYRLPVRLMAVPPPVEEVETHDLTNGAAGGDRPDLTRSGASHWFSDVEIRRVPDVTRGIAELGRLSSVSSAGLSTEGLPGRLSGIVMDGVPFVGAEHPDLPTLSVRGTPFSRDIVEEAELLTNGLDVEWSHFPGGTLSGYTTSGSRRIRAHLFGDWSGQYVAQSDHFNPDAVRHNIVRAGAVVRGPVLPDTAEFVVGGEYRRVETPMPRLWRGHGLDSTLLAVATDSFGTDLTPYVRSLRRDLEIGSIFGRFDGRITEDFGVSVRANAALFKMTNPDLGVRRITGFGSTVEGEDVSATATLTSRLSSAVGVEVRGGLEISNRNHTAGGLPATVFVDGPIAFGTDPALPGEFERIGFRGTGVLHAHLGAHRLKFGSAASLASFDMTYDYGRNGVFLYGSMDGFARREGVFVQSVGTLPVARFNTAQFGGFFQDAWTLVPGFEFTAGLRFDVELLPNDQVRLNEDWESLTGLRGTDFSSSILKWSPRFGLVIGTPQQWQARAEFGTYYGETEPSAFAEAIVHAGAAEVRRGAGALGRWPGTPDSVSAPVAGPSLALLAPRFRPPRTSRASLGVTGVLGRHTKFHLSAVYRHTDFLTRRADLNLLAAPVAHDQHGRPIFGVLTKQSALLTAAPGTNRRFPEFDLVSAVNADGVSDYWGFTVEIERRLSSFVSGTVGYTYSVTQDNVLGELRAGPWAHLSPFPYGLGGHDWAEGRSDFDAPHQVAAGLEMELPLSQLIGFLPRLRVAGFYRFRSGLPFTPGFRGGVDVNGDGAFYNDPAFVDDRVAGVSELFGRWDCLRGQVGRFAARNACRGPGMHTLDVRVSAPLRLLGKPVLLMVDGLNLLDADLPILDHALFLVDPGGTFSVDGTTGRVVLPLVTNPDFGRTVGRRTTGRRLRLGARIGYE